MKDFVFLSLFALASLISVRSSFRAALDGLFKGMNKSLTGDLQKHLDMVKDTNAPKGVQNILQRKGDEFRKLEAVFTNKCNQEFEEKLKDVNDSVKARVKEQMNQVHKIFDENYDGFKDIAAAEHYREVKPFYDFVCAFRLMDDILDDVWHKKEYGGIKRAKDLMIEMKKTETVMKSNIFPSVILSPPHMQFADYVVPGEKRHDVDRVYNKWRLYVYNELNQLATNIRSELESTRGERPIEDIIIEFAFIMAKMRPYAKFVHRDVIPQVRRMAQENYKNQTAVTPFLDELRKQMPQEKWYFPRQYLDHFNVLLRAMGKPEFQALEYHRDDMKTLIPGSEQCLGDKNYADGTGFEGNDCREICCCIGGIPGKSGWRRVTNQTLHRFW